MRRAAPSGRMAPDAAAATGEPSAMLHVVHGADSCSTVEGATVEALGLQPSAPAASAAVLRAAAAAAESAAAALLSAAAAHSTAAGHSFQPSSRSERRIALCSRRSCSIAQRSGGAQHSDRTSVAHSTATRRRFASAAARL
ncbi:hypothetical protein FA09DRAFT_100757 [Tilletiopsis washingtonensis]|uniref:Uncharacterized protein n=1 Tax=Tilletiopsis washingtonensis TaxID=58919 RepID=A0A316Z4T0_9BASI|nr:hypothetical protein FA09DRAFT_100757 [Tilletiopsis washingtonensis]PWN95942.1 hypothetical protein FA09DRAFT_100757 [Tilletiopsis washingtonensis]